MFVDDLLHLIVEQLDVVVDRSVEVVQRRLQDVVLEGCDVDAAYVTVLVPRDSRWTHHGTCKRQVTRSWSLKHVGWTATRDKRPVSLADVNNKSSVLLPRVVSCTCCIRS